MDWKKKYCKYVDNDPKQSTHSVQSQSKCTSILLKARTNNPKTSKEPQKTLNSQTIIEEENQSWRPHNPRL